MAGYTRQDTANNIANGNVIDADDFDAEYNAIESSFNASTGHKHDGTAGEGAPITKVGPSQDLVVSASSVLPKTTNTLDLGSSTIQFKNAWFAGAVTSNVTGDVTGNVSVPDNITFTEGTSDWKVEVNASDELIISYGGTGKMKLDSSGNLTITGTVTESGSV